MADGLNKVMLIGHLGADPEMRYTANGAAVTTFRMAVSRGWTTESGDRREETEWLSVVTWNKLAEICAQHLGKGRKVYVDGRLATRSWEKDGQKHYRTEVVASNVLFLERKDGSGPSGGYADAGEEDPSDLPFA